MLVVPKFYELINERLIANFIGPIFLVFLESSSDGAEAESLLKTWMKTVRIFDCNGNRIKKLF
jgi:hypothetical protein